MDTRDKTFLIGQTLVQVWEGQHPHEHAHCWKWNVVDTETGDIEWQGFTDFQEDAIIHAFRHLTFDSLRKCEDREFLESMWPGLAAYRPIAPVPTDMDSLWHNEYPENHDESYGQE